MFLAYAFKLKPTKAQRMRLEQTLELQRQLYNAALQERREAWRLGQHRITKFDQMRSLTQIRADDAGYAAVPSTLSRWTLTKVDLAYAAFFKRAKAKQGRAGYPRFRSKTGWRSFGFAEWKGIRLVDRRLVIKGVGAIRVHIHRPIPNDVKFCSATVTRDGTSWRIAVQMRVADFVGPHTHAGLKIGIDLNVLNRATMSDGAVFANPRHSNKNGAAIRIARRCIARGRKSSKRREKAVARLSRFARKIANQRKTALHQASAQIGREYGVIAVERLLIANMTRSAKGTVERPGKNVRAKSGLNRALLDVAPAMFISMLRYKAERAGGRLIEVAPHNTSRDCSACGEAAPKTLKQRVHRCQHCGLVMDRDHNAARNILFRAQAVVGLRDVNVDQKDGGSILQRSCVISGISFKIADAISN